MLDFLQVNETKPYSTSVLNTELIRTGTDQSGSCFFYSLYYPFKDFRELPSDERKVYIENKRMELANKIQFEEWFLIQNGNIAFLQIIETMRLIMHSIPKLLLDNQEYFEKYDVNPVAIDILFTLLNPNLVEQEILPQWDMECSKKYQAENEESYLEQIKNTWYDIYKIKVKKAIDELEKKIDSHVPKMSADKKSKVIQKLSLLSYPIFDFVTSKALSDFKAEISDPKKWLNVFIFSSVVDYLNLKVNIIILDEETGMPYEGMKLLYKKHVFKNDHPFVVILYFKDMHFESLGKKTTINKKTIIQRLFKKDDPFIITCLTYLEEDEESTTRVN